MTETNFLCGKKVLISGASGFVGRHLSKTIRDMGADVSVTFHKNDVPGDCFDTLFYCDLMDTHRIQEILEEAEPDYVFHLAAQALVGVGQDDACRTLDTNIVGTINLLQALNFYQTTNRLSAVIVASSDKSYGRHKVLPYTEDFALLGTNQVYETSKNCEDILAQMAAYSWGLPIGITRFGNVYGPGDFHFDRLIPGAIKAFCERGILRIRSNGQHYRDFIFIDDVVQGYIALANFVSNNQDTSPHIFNFGTGVPARVLDVVSMIREYFPDSHNPHILRGAKDEIHRQYVCSNKANELLGWSPKTKLKNGLLTTVDWYKNLFSDMP